MDITEQTPKVLWCVNIHGPDDVVAVDSYLAAVNAANAFNKWWAEYRTGKPLHEEFDARMWAVPVEWHGSAESHAKAVASPSPDYASFLDPALALPQPEPVAWLIEHNGKVIEAYLDEDTARIRHECFPYAKLRSYYAPLPVPGAPSAEPWPEGFFKLSGDDRLRACATAGCGQHVSIRLERDDVGSNYCESCARKIAENLRRPPSADDDLIAAREAAAILHEMKDKQAAAIVFREGRLDDYEVVQSALLALRTERARRGSGAREVRVKALEWVDGYMAETPFGSYTVTENSSDRWEWTFHSYPYGTPDDTTFDTIEGAKAAAQADFEARIRAATASGDAP